LTPDGFFPSSYFDSRERFRSSLGLVRGCWPEATLDSYVIDSLEDLTIDWIEAPATHQPERLLILTTAEHGAEGIVGAAVLHLFTSEFLSRLDPARNGLLLVHAINPWGLQHQRRVNRHNVDINRNFFDAQEPYSAPNPSYHQIESFLNPNQPIHPLSDLIFLIRLFGVLVKLGVSGLKTAALLGQGQFPKGIYYSGQKQQEETKQVIRLFRRFIANYQRTILLDMHTGYGPRYQMSLVTSLQEQEDSSFFMEKYAYPRVVKGNAAEFFEMQGDMIEYVYRMARGEFPGRLVYAASFEFGTNGDTFLGGLRSLRATIQENQIHWYGASSPHLRERTQDRYRELFAPDELRWREKALADARQALEGILRGEGWIEASG